MMASNNILVLSLVFLLVVTAEQTTSASSAALATSLPGGPFVDELVFKVFEGYDQQVLALINDEVDLLGESVDPTYLPSLESVEGIEVAHGIRNGYGYLAIKTDKYPFNITGFRRAFAFALDKERICNDIWDGLAVPQDSPVPCMNPFSIEGALPYNYYEADVELGNSLLDAAGFADVDSDGWREAPDGSEFNVIVESAVSSSVAIEIIEAAAETLRGLHVDAISEPPSYEYPYRLFLHGDFDMFFLRTDFTSFDVDWLAYEFWSGYADEPYHNLPCWQNATYDSWREQLLHATNHDEVYQAASEMQKIWTHACPGVICYDSLFLTSYRTDKFEGHLNDVVGGVAGWWTNYRVHLIEPEGGPFGGQFRWSTPLDPDTFNFMVTSSDYTRNTLNNLYDSLIRQDPDGNDIPWLTERYTTETHDDNPAVPEGHTRFTFSIVRNATWSDGTPLTGADVAFTLNYYREAPGNPYGADLANMTAALAPVPYTVVVEFDTESFWHLHTVGYKPILPKHFFEAIGPAGWSSWDPTYDSLVTSGPFTTSEYVPGEFVHLTYNPEYFCRARFTEWVPLPGPALGHPTDMAYSAATQGNIITWTASSWAPTTYAVYKNGTLYASGSWTTGSIYVNVDGLPVGTYNFTISVFDSAMNSASDTVWVTVFAATTTQTTTSITSTVWTSGPFSPLSMGITAGSLVVMILVGGYTVLFRRRNGA